MKRGLLIHPDELGGRWPQRILDSRLGLFGLHPPGGADAHRTMQALIDGLPALAPALDAMAARGIAVEHEMHALRWLMPASLFGAHPDWFRMNERGERTNDFNICASNPDALACLSERSALAARLLPSATHRYHFWIDDRKDAHCRCPACRHLSASDQALILCNAILEGLQRTDPAAQLCYLAYFDTMPLPRHAEPRDGIYLEYAPMGRDFSRPLTDRSCEKNVSETAGLRDLLAFFGREGATACEYWLDNSMYSGWKKPPKPFVWNRAVTEADLVFYEDMGFDFATTFACFLGPDYETEHGSFPDISAYLRG